MKKSTNRTAHKSTSHSQRLALESRLVFDGAIAATAVDVQANSVDHTAATQPTSEAAPPPSEPAFDLAQIEKPAAVIDYQPIADTTNHQPAFTPLATDHPLDATDLALSPVVGLGSEHATTLIVVDPRADNAVTLIANPPANTQIITLDSTRDGFQQVAELLQGRNDVTELHLLPWTQGSTQWLGNKSLTTALDSAGSNALTQWGDSFTDNATIVFHGSNTLGTSWLNHIDALTGADTQWSQDPIQATAPTTSLFVLSDASSPYADTLSAAEKMTQTTLTNWFQKDNVLSQLAIPFSANADTGAWTNNAIALRNTILNGDYSIRLEVRSNTELNGVLGAFSAVGTTNQPTIYLNTEWLSTATPEAIQTVLLEELGHSFDNRLNNGADSQGDEGHAFVGLMLYNNANIIANRQDNDHGFINVDGQTVAIEAASTSVQSIAITSTPAAPTGYVIGEVIQATVTFNLPEIVIGTPSLELDIGGNIRTAKYVSGSGTANLVFSYTVVAGDADNAGGITVVANSLATDGGSINNGLDAATITHITTGTANTQTINTTVFAADTTAPLFRSAVGAGSTITLTYDEIGSGLNAAMASAAGNFSFSRNGAVGPQLTVNSVSVNHAAQTVSLGLSGLIANADTNMSISYTPSGVNNIQDVAGNTVTGFSNVFVANVMPSFNVKGNAMIFVNPTALTAGDGLNTGNKILFSNIITVDGQSIDAIVTTNALVNIQLNSVDNLAALVGAPTNVNWFELDTYIPALSGFGAATFTFDFIKSGTYNVTNLTASGGVDVVLQNVAVNSYDIDTSTGNFASRQLQDFSGFATYTLAGPDPITLTNGTRLTESQQGGFTRFEYTLTTPLTAPVTNPNVTFGGVAFDQARVMALYESIHSFSITTGAYDGNVAYYYLDFSKGPNWANPEKTYHIPTANPKTTNDTTPDLTGTFVGTVTNSTDQAYTLSITVNGVTYTAGEVAGERTTIVGGIDNGKIQLLDATTGLRGIFDPTTGAGTWSLTVPTPLPLATYDIAVAVGYGASLATITNHTYDVTTNELIINGLAPDTTKPTLISFTRLNPLSANILPANLAAQPYVDFVATFSESVTNVNVADFLIKSGSVTGATINSIITQSGGSAYTIRVNIPTNTLTGTLNLDLVATNDLVDLAGNLLGGTTNDLIPSFSTGHLNDDLLTDQTYTIGDSANFAISATPTINEDLSDVTTFVLTMSGSLTAGNTATVDLTRTGTSTDGTDYSAAFLTALNAALPAGVTLVGNTLHFTSTYNAATPIRFSMTATNDTLADSGETIIGTLSNATINNGTATISTATATTTITDADQGVSFAISATPTINEDLSDVTTFVLTMSGSLTAGNTATVDLTRTGTSTDGTDYSAAFLTALNAALPAGVTLVGNTLHFTSTYNAATPIRFSMTATNDTLADSGETIIGTLSNATINNSTATISTATATTTITDADQGVSFAISATPTINEDLSDVTTFVLTMSGSLTAGNTATVDLTRTGTSTDGTDYSAAFLTALNAALPAGVTLVGNTLHFTSTYNAATPIRFSMTATNDTLADSGETIIGTLSNATINNGTATISTATATTTITDADQGVSFAISATPTINEDLSDVTTFVLTMSGSLTAGNTATVDLTRTGTSTDGTDYSAAFLTALNAALPAGVTLVGNTLHFTSTYNAATPIRFSMTAINDTLADNGETIIGTLSNATINNGTATISTATATTTITDADQGVSFAISATPTINEDLSDVTTFVLTMSGSLTAGNTATVDLTRTGTSTDGTDYSAAFLTALNAALPAGVTLVGNTLHFTSTYNAATPIRFSMTAINDTLADNGETIIGTLSNATINNGTATISTATATTTITDADQGVSFAISATPTINEDLSDVTTFVLTMSGSLTAGNTATVDLTRTGTSTDGTDYSAAFLTALNAALPAGVTLVGNTLHFTSTYNAATPIRFSMTATNDTLADSGETIIGTLSNATINNGTATISTATATTTITDADQGVSFAISATPTINEDLSDVTTFVLTMSGSLTAGNTATVDLTRTGTSTDGTDYSAAFLTALNAALPAGVTLVGNTLHFTSTYNAATPIRFSMTAINDTLADNGETIIGTLSNATINNGTATISTATATTTITDADQGVSFAISATPTINEDLSDVTTFVLTMSGSLTAGNTATVDLTRTGTSTDGTDYSAAFLTALNAALPAGVTLVGNTLHFTSTYNAATPIRFSMTATNDTLADSGETIIGTLSNATINNGTATISTATATTTITDADTNPPSVFPPTAINDHATGISGKPVIINVIGNDTDLENDINPTTVKIVGTTNSGDPLVVTGQGTWTVNKITGAITFTPFAGFTGDPTPISYTVQDNTGLTSNPATVTVDYPQAPPVAVNDYATGISGKPVIINVIGNDTDPENDINPATVKIVGTTNSGDPLVVTGQGTWTVNKITGAITFTPFAGFTGDPTPISYTVQDNTGLTSNPATVIVDYPQALPVAVNDYATGISGKPVIINVIGNDTDPENDINPATVKIVGTTNSGDPLVVTGQGTWTVNKITGAITFTPFAGFTGDPTPISYTVQDSTGLTSNPATATVDYPQAPPIATNDMTTGISGQPVTINVLNNDSHSNNIDPATVKIVGTTNSGDPLVMTGQGTWTVNKTTGAITFTPFVGFTGDPTPISYTVQDNTGLVSNAASVGIDYPQDIGMSGSVIMLSNPDRAILPSQVILETTVTDIYYRQPKVNDSLPPIHLSLYTPTRNYILSLTGSLRDQVVLELERYSFTVPRWSFRHTDPNEQLEFKATRANGTGLPQWLKFDPKTLIFSGIPPKGAQNERVMVTARDTNGNEVHAMFKVHVNKECSRQIHGDKPCDAFNKVFKKHRIGEKLVTGSKAGLAEQVHAIGKLSKLQESRALLDSLKSL